jgi:ABC-type transport system involved in multi-copper enzyme maturation permease subunit
MPIHDQGYRRYGGHRAPPGHAWAVIARAGIRTLLSRRAFIALLLLAWVPFLVRAVQIYAATNIPQATFLAPDVAMFRRFLEIQEVFLFFITVYAGAGLIANDRRANALQIYLARPMTRFEYVFGKFAVLMAFLLLVTWVPALLLLVVQVLFSGSLAFFLANLALVPAVTIFSFVQAAVVAIAMLALSSLSNSSRYVGILYAGLIFFSQAVYGVLFAMTRDSRLAWVSLPLDLAQVGDAMFRLPLRFHMPLWLAALLIAALVAVSIVILEKRLRGVEIIA